MRPQGPYTLSSVTATAAIPLDSKQSPFNVGFGVVVAGGSTLTYNIEHTFDDVLSGATPTWFQHSTVTAQTTSKDGNYAFPVRAVRLNVTAWTVGSVTVNFLQGGV